MSQSGDGRPSELILDPDAFSKAARREYPAKDKGQIPGEGKTDQIGIGGSLNWTASGQILMIQLLGGFRLVFGETEVTGMDRARLQELLAYLVLNRGQPINRLRLACLFWPDSLESQARANFRNLLHRLRGVFPEVDRFLVTGSLVIQWQADTPYWLDVAAFEECLKQATGVVTSSVKIDHLERAVDIYQGELLPGCYSEWLLAERERLAQAYTRALEQIVGLYEAHRQYQQAIVHAQTLLRHDPLYEPAYTQLIRLHALNDDRAASLHTYHTCATILRRELDIEPDASTRQLYEQLHDQTIPQAPMRAAIPLVGRDNKWKLLQQSWKKASRYPQLVLITGEAGIGKTRLAEGLLNWVGRQGILALTARCYATAGKLAYAPIVSWLRSQPLPELEVTWLRELARLLPEILASHPELPPPGPLTEKWQRLHLFEALARALLSNHKALLLFLDDLQWCDQETLDWLTFLLAYARERKRQLQLLVVAALRSEDSQPGSMIALWQSDLIRSDQLLTMQLGPLNQDATLILADHVGGQSFDRGLTNLLYQATEGNPLFIVEMVRAGFDDHAIMSSHQPTSRLSPLTPMPDRVRQVLMARLAQLSAPARDVIECASVIGRAFSFDVLASVVDINKKMLVDCLDECWQRQVIREQGDQSYDFSHEKLRETAYANLSLTRRTWLHSRVAETLERLHKDNLEPVASILAGHYEIAQMAPTAIAYYQQAAETARRIYAHNETAQLLEKAIYLLDVLPAGAEREISNAQLQEAWGDLHAWQAQHETAQAAYRTALNHIHTEDKLSQARLHRKIGMTMENERMEYDLIAVEYELAYSLLGKPTEGADAAWWKEWCALQINQVGLLYWWQRIEDMQKHIARIQPFVDQHGTPMQRANLNNSLVHQLVLKNRFVPPKAAIDYARAALDALSPGENPEDVQTANPELLALPYFTLGFNLLFHGEAAAGEKYLRLGLDMAEQVGNVVVQARCLAYLVAAGRRQGNDPIVREFVQRCLTVAERARMYDYIGVAQAGLAWLAWRGRGRGTATTTIAESKALIETQRWARLALEAWHRHKSPYPLQWMALWPLMGVQLAQNRVDEAINCAKLICDPVQQAQPSILHSPLTDALVAWEGGQPDEAGRLLRHALAEAERMNFF